MGQNIQLLREQPSDSVYVMKAPELLSDSVVRPGLIRSAAMRVDLQNRAYRIETPAAIDQISPSRRIDP